MKKKALIITSLFAALAIAVGLWMRRQSDWQFVGRVTGFVFPPGTEYLAQYDNAEWFIVSVVRLPADAISAFTREHRFVTGERSSVPTVLSLPARYREIPDRPDLLRAQGQRGFQAWEALFDPRSRLLWIQITYPDWGGAHPGTAPQPNREKPNQP